MLEKFLSIDNLFVFVVLFQTLAVSVVQQHRVLYFGVVGALTMPAAFIAAGAALLEHTSWTFPTYSASPSQPPASTWPEPGETGPISMPSPRRHHLFAAVSHQPSQISSHTRQETSDVKTSLDRQRRHEAHRTRVEGRPPGNYTADHAAKPGVQDRDWFEVLTVAILSDLRVMPTLARDLPSGGLPQAGYLAEHGYVICDALGHHLAHQTSATAPGEDKTDEQATAPDAHAMVTAALGDVLCRLERLYSAERPGGLDHIDEHLAHLYRTANAYLRRPPPPGGPTTTSRDIHTDPARPSWWDGLGHRQAARILAWAMTASGEPSPGVLAAQALPVRLLLHLGYNRRAARRASLLGLRRAPASKPK